MFNKLKFQDKNSFWLISTLSVQAILISQTLFKVFPITIGFFPYWARLSQTQTIYKDFFYPFPPLSLLIEGSLPRLFSNVAVAEQILQASKWLLITATLFLILRQLRFTPMASFIGVTVAATAYYVSPGNITAGYLELVWLFLLLAVLSALKTFQNQKYSLYAAFLTGLFLSFASLTKQTGLIPSALLIGIVIIMAILWRINRPLLIPSIMVLGFLIPILFFIFLAIFQNNLPDAIVSIFSGGGKNPLGSDKWFYWLWEGLGIKSPKIPIIFVISGLTFLYFRKTLGYEKKTSEIFLIAGIVFSQLGILGFIGLDPLQGIVQGKINSWVIIALAALAVSAYFFERNQSGIISNYTAILLPVFSAILIILGTKIPSYDGALEQWVTNYSVYINQLGGFCTLLFLILTIQNWQRIRTPLIPKFAYLQILFAVSFGFAVMNSLSAGLGIETWILPVAIASSQFVKIIDKNLKSFTSKIAILLSLLLILLPMTVSQAIKPYEWWGIAEDSLDTVHQSLEIPGLSGFKLGEQTTNQYKELSNFLNEFQDGSPVLLGPNIAGIVGEVFTNVKTYRLDCPILWWDLCPDKLVESDFTNLKKNPPEYIIWNLAPEYVVAGHENDFMNSKSSTLRKLQRWVISMSKNGEYEILSTGETDTNGWEILVLQKKS